MSLGRRILTNGLSIGIQKLVRIFEQLLLVPFFIASWGVSYYGEWLSITTIPSLLAFADLGIGTAASNLIVLSYVSGNIEEAFKTSVIGRRLISISIISVIVLSCIVLGVLYVFNFLDHLVISSNDVIKTTILLMSARCVSFYQQLYDGYFRAVGRPGVSINMSTIQSAGKLLGSWILLQYGAKIVDLALFDFCFTAVFTFIFCRFASTYLRFPTGVTINISRIDLVSLLRKGMSFMLSPVWQAIYFQGTTMAVRIILGPSAVAVFSTLRTMSRSLNQLFNLINGATFPDLQHQIAIKQYPTVRKIYRIAISTSIGLSLLAIIPLATFGLTIYKYWTGGFIVPSKSVWLLFLLGVSANAIWWTTCVIFRASNKPEGFTTAGFVSAIFSVLATFVLSKYFGIIGASLGFVVFDFIMLFYVIPATSKIIGQSLRTLPTDMVEDARHLLAVGTAKLSGVINRRA